ncbi:Polyphenol oxidase [Spatholobus suberectus]|nr:Polyphenol oxidase [Spatholobus suberectus]
MASIYAISRLSLTDFSAPLPISICSSSSTFPRFQPPWQPTKRSKPKRHQVSKLSCHTNQNDPTPNPEEGKPSDNIVSGKNRRDVLIGMGGLYGASTLSNNNPLALADPILPPVLTSCGPPDDLPSYASDLNCCPPTSSNIVDFKFPSPTTPLRASSLENLNYRAGDDPEPGGGTVENIPHTPVHVWTGDKRQPKGEDMGAFYTSGRDPIFYSHHANVDRMWNIWKTIPGGKRKDLTDPDWLEIALTREIKLGYVYQDVDIPWLNNKPKPRRKSKGKKVALAQDFGIGAAQAAEASVQFPLTLDSKVSTLVKRPKLSRSKKEKEEEEEVLVIDGIDFDCQESVKFDVFVNDEDDKVIGPANTEFAGSFVSLPHSHGKSKKIKTSLRLAITDLLEDLEAENDDSIVVTLVPKYGIGVATIKGIKIEFVTE